MGDVTVSNVNSTAVQFNVAAKGWRNRTIEIQAESNAVYILFGPNNTVTANAVAFSGNQQSVIVPVGTSVRCRPKWGTDAFMSVVTNGSNTAIVRITINSENTIEQGNRLG